LHSGLSTQLALALSALVHKYARLTQSGLHPVCAVFEYHSITEHVLDVGAIVGGRVGLAVGCDVGEVGSIVGTLVGERDGCDVVVVDESCSLLFFRS